MITHLRLRNLVWIRASVNDIVSDGRREQHWLLTNGSDVSTPVRWVQIFQIDTIDKDLSVRRVVESGNVDMGSERASEALKSSLLESRWSSKEPFESQDSSLF